MHTTVSAIGIRLCWCSIFVSQIGQYFDIEFFEIWWNVSLHICDFIHVFRTECFCGNSIPDNTVKLPDPECNYKCSGDTKQLCGGYFTISIFETGIKRKLDGYIEVISSEN